MSEVKEATLEDLMEEIGRRVNEMVIVVRVRPQVLGSGPPAVVSAGKGDMGDQLGLCALLDSQLRASHALDLRQRLAGQDRKKGGGGPR